jgi:hypothetical protein
MTSSLHFTLVLSWLRMDTWFNKRQRYIIALLFYVNIVNIIFLFLRMSGVFMLRPVIVYEYVAIMALIAFRVPRIIIWLYFVVVLLTDVISQLSFTFLFTVPEFLKNLQFYLLYDFSLGHYLSLVLFIIFISLNYWTLKKLQLAEGAHRYAVLLFMFVFVASVYLIDVLNGKTLLNERKIVSWYNFNLGAALAREAYFYARDVASNSEPPQKMEPSITFQTFGSDTTGNQLLIIMESWGVPQNQDQWIAIQRAITSGSPWRAEFGTTNFDGGTVRSELRELLNVTGDYRYMLNADTAKKIPSIFRLKKSQGYTTSAIHSFSGKMFQRSTWWPNIGIDSVFFLEHVIDRKKLNKDDLNYSSPFPSLHDETAYQFIARPRNNEKTFTYFLTVNSHLPFHASGELPKIDQLDPQLSDEAENQIARIVQLVQFFVNEDNNWAKILIVGDHMPPFSNEFDRKYYSRDKVPYVVFSR